MADKSTPSAPPVAAPNREHSYGPGQVKRYITYLGCWWSPNPAGALFDRDKAEYIRLLRRWIETNRTRNDAIGRLESAEATKVLQELGQ